MSDQTLRERLFELENRSPALEDKFRKELRKMMERRLRPLERILWFISIGLGLFFVVFFAYYAATAPHGFPLLARLGFVTGSVFGCAWVALGVWTLRQGAVNWFRLDNAIHGVTFGMVLVLLVISMVLAGQMSDKVAGLQLVLYGSVFFMIFGIPALFNLRISRAETTLREQLLQVRLELAELSDSISKPD